MAKKHIIDGTCAFCLKGACSACANLTFPCKECLTLHSECIKQGSGKSGLDWLKELTKKVFCVKCEDGIEKHDFQNHTCQDKSISFEDLLLDIVKVVKERH